jgi:hypothetical protein
MTVKDLLKLSNKDISEYIFKDYPVSRCRCYGDCDGECYDYQRKRIKEKIEFLIKILDEKDK